MVLVLTGHTLKDADYTIDFHRGTLLTTEESAGREAEIAGLQRNAQVVEATPAAVLAALKGRVGMSEGLTSESGNPAAPAGHLGQSRLGL